METILEQQRRYHEERERLIESMVKEMVYKKSSRYMECSRLLKELYEDKDNLRKEEVAALSGPNEFAEFYTRLKNIKEFHRKHPNEICVPMSMEFEEFAKLRDNASEDAMNLIEFTDEEGYGKYLDLHECYEKYINLKGVDRVDYITYLTTFDQLFDIPKERKNAQYRQYLVALIDYLSDYLARVKPLLDQSLEIASIRQEFEKHWETGIFPGWPVGGCNPTRIAHCEELMSLGLDRLKSALLALGLKCGGTLEERAQRLWNTKGKRLYELDQSLFARSKPGKPARSKENEQRQRDIAFLEAQVYKLVEVLSEQRAATKDNVQRKQGRAEGEQEEEESSAEEEEEEEDDDIPYNPKNLPLGWDGKPIPYWLYKLHGLNISYTCEICGNYVYKGPKAYQRHFAKLKKMKAEERWKPDQEEEYEDSQGNVVNKKTYEDLKRQGLL